MSTDITTPSAPCLRGHTMTCYCTNTQGTFCISRRRRSEWCDIIRNEAITTGTLYFAMMMFYVCRLASLSFVRKMGESLLIGTFLLLTGFAPLAFNRTDTSFTQHTLHKGRRSNGSNRIWPTLRTSLLRRKSDNKNRRIAIS